MTYLINVMDVRETAKSGTGCADNRHLRCFAEPNYLNSGSLYVEVSSLPVKRAGGGVTVVVRGWESHLHGEGSQSDGTSKAKRNRPPQGRRVNAYERR